jgi:hypothetical protein
MTARAPHRRRRRITSGWSAVGTQTSGATPMSGPTNPGGATPIERVRVAVETDRPGRSTTGSALNTRCQSACEMTATRTGAPQSIIVGREPATEWDCDPKNLEVIAAHELPGERFRLTVRIIVIDTCV